MQSTIEFCVIVGLLGVVLSSRAGDAPRPDIVHFTEYLDDDEGRFGLRGNSESRKHYSHDLLTERALNFIREARGVQNDSFFTPRTRCLTSRQETRTKMV